MEEAGVKFLRIKRGDKGHAQIRFNPNRPQRDTALYCENIASAAG